MKQIPFLDEQEILQPPLHYDKSGLVAIGGNLSAHSLVNAYSKGVFPWYNEDEMIQWWSPDPRCVLYPADVKISKSMKQILQNPKFQFKINQNFNAVINACAAIERLGQDGTWIHKEMKLAYIDLHQKGIAICAETYYESVLVGGLYGLRIGNVFFGESMFSSISNASKYALINFCEYLDATGCTIIDCQLETAHLRSMGATLITRDTFLKELEQNL